MIDGKFAELVHSSKVKGVYDKFREAYRLILSGVSDLGYDTSKDQNFHETESRASLALLEMIVDQEKLEAALYDIRRATFEVEHDNLVAEYDIRSSVLCPHHLLPFFCSTSVGYVPMEKGATSKVVGLSKLPRLVKILSRRPVCQEGLVNLICDHLYGKSALIPTSGCAVSTVAIHSCIRCRGVEDQTSFTVINGVRGIFMDNKSGVRDEFLRRAERINRLL